MGIGIQFNPSRQPGVVLRLDARSPGRMLIRKRLVSVRSLAGFALLGLAAGLQLEAWRSHSPGQALFGALLALVGTALATLPRRLALDRTRGQVEERCGWLLPVWSQTTPLSSISEVRITVESRGASQGESTVYAIELVGPEGIDVDVDAPGYWETAMTVAEPLAAFLSLPMSDPGRSGTRSAATLDRPLRDERETGAGVPRAPPQRLVVLTDTDELLQARSPRPFGALFVALTIAVALFCAIPLTIEVLLPLWHGYALRSLVGPIAWSTLPLLIVGGTALRYHLTTGADIEVTPGRLRVSQLAPLRRKVTIPGAELEHLIVLAPEMGGSRSLLAFFSDGVLVARSDRASVRFGYGLSMGDLLWLRSRAIEVLRPRSPRAILREPAPPTTQVPPALLSQPGAGLLLGAGALALAVELWAPPMRWGPFGAGWIPVVAVFDVAAWEAVLGATVRALRRVRKTAPGPSLAPPKR